MLENKKLSFKEAFNKLQNILQKLETQEHDIKEMTNLYKEGLELKKYCSDILEKEKTEIIKIAEKNGISKDAIGLEENENN